MTIQKQLSAQALIADYAQSCAFIHDDWIPSLGVMEWGQYNTNPFLIGADVCVVYSMAGFGADYIDYLRNMNAFPRHIIVPKATDNSVVVSLLNDEQALAQLRDLVQERRLDISTFFSDDARDWPRLLAALSSDAHTPLLQPSQAVFSVMNSKFSIMDYPKRAGVPAPEGQECRSFDEVLTFFRDHSRCYPAAIIKEDHRDLHRVSSETELMALQQRLRFPLLVETLYDVKVSPIVNFIIWKDQHKPLFTVNQVLRHLLHSGNESPTGLAPHIMDTMVDYTRRIAAEMTGFNGILGIDYIVTPDDDVFAVDINPRFCASTYPFTFLQRLGFDVGRVHAHYQLVKCRIPSLSALFNDTEFIPLTTERPYGMFLYTPVLYNHELPVEYFSYLLVGGNAKELADLEARMMRITKRFDSHSETI